MNNQDLNPELTNHLNSVDADLDAAQRRVDFARIRYRYDQKMLLTLDFAQDRIDHQRALVANVRAEIIATRTTLTLV